MKQHLFAEQLKELSYEERIVLLSLVTGLTKDYLRDEYREGIKDEDAVLRAYGFNVKVGEMIEIIESYTRQFPVPTIEHGKYAINLKWKNIREEEMEAHSDFKDSYCDALFEIVKQLLKARYI